MADAEGADNAVAFLNRIKSHAEDKGVTICMEMMNSKLQDPGLGRKDQMCDHIGWGVDVMQARELAARPDYCATFIICRSWMAMSAGTSNRIFSGSRISIPAAFRTGMSSTIRRS